MIPARTSGTKHRPMTAPARATSRASRREQADPGEDCVLDRLRHAGIADSQAIASRLLAQRADELLDVEGNAVGPLVDRCHDVARRRKASPENERGHQRGLVKVERVEAGLFGQPLGDEPRAPLAEERAWRELLGPVRADDEHLDIPDAARQLADDLEADLVGPLQVLEVEHDRRSKLATILSTTSRTYIRREPSASASRSWCIWSRS